ncbi:MAG: MmcQ/YjbR family DNA-binding protein [Thermoanaerobaculia bacterium]
MAMTWKQVCRLARRLPEVREGTWFRTPSLEVRAKSFVRLKEDGQTVVFLLENLDEQELLLLAKPRVFFITDHYRGWPAVLARLSKLHPAECRIRLERAWRKKAPKALVKERESGGKAAVRARRPL